MKYFYYNGKKKFRFKTRNKYLKVLGLNLISISSIDSTAGQKLYKIDKFLFNLI